MKRYYLSLSLLLLANTVHGHDCAPSIFVPRQLSYNPILENALTLDQLKKSDEWGYAFSVKPVYTQNVGSKFDRYFNINRADCLKVQEDGSGDIDSLWFQTISSDPTFYSSTLSFEPIRRTYGALFFFEVKLPRDFRLSVNTALVTAQNDMRISERNIENTGTAAYLTITESLASSTRKYGKVCGKHTKTSLDDIQVKLLKNVCTTDDYSWDLYGLLGIPTGSGTKAVQLFEPLVGSKHAQIGFGSYYFHNLYACESSALSFLSEIKWRYAFSGKNRRVFDLAENGQWSRYMLLVNEAAKSDAFFASNNLAFETNVTPRNSLDIYLALHGEKCSFNYELGYDFWFRNRERTSLNKCCEFTSNTGVADLRGIAALDPQSASRANISQSVQPGANQMVSDMNFVPVTPASLNMRSGAAPQAFSNSFYGSLAYAATCGDTPVSVGLSAAYELGDKYNTPDNVFVWLNVDVTF